jgi:Mn2+/Fe2+ NRAMP family transporter
MKASAPPSPPRRPAPDARGHPPGRGDPPGRLRRAWRTLGPGLVTGASDDDPSGIATYAQGGAKYGFGMLWTALITLPLMMAIQEICDRTALATGKTLGELARAHFGRWARACIGVLIVALVAANALNIAADLVAIGFIGSGMLAVPVLAGSGSVGLAGLLGRPWGLSLSVRKAPFFYALIAAGTVGGAALTLTSTNPITLLVLSAVINGIAAAPFLIVVMIISHNRQLMGTSRNHLLATVLGWITVAMMTIAAVAMLALLAGL